MKTPVVLIIFKRPESTQKVFDVIRQIKPSKLFVIADGSRSNHPLEAEQCAKTRAIINQVDWDCQVLTHYSEINLGCKERVSSGLNWVFSLVEEAIILEDDCIPDLSFFYFCQELLIRYRDDSRVMQITGENTHRYQSANSSYYFSQYSFYWGWATWRRAWQLFDKKMKSWLKLRESRWLEKLLGNQNSAQYWTEIFDLTYNGFNSWGWAWTFTCFVNRGLCIVPNQNLISNIGFGKDAAHTTWEVDEIANLPIQSIHFPLKHPTAVEIDVEAEAVIDKRRFTGRKYLRGMQQQAIDLSNQGQHQAALQIWKNCIKFRPDLIDLHNDFFQSNKRLSSQVSQLINTDDPNQQRFLVYTMGKVGSTSIAMSLKNYAEQVYNIHFLDETYLRNNMHKSHCVDSYFVLKNWLGQPIKIISMVRNPIDINIGEFFQNIEMYYPHLKREQIQQLTVEKLIQKFWTLNPNYPLTWFEREFNKSLGFDIYAQPFSVLGWKTYLHHSYHILVMQTELIDSQKEEIIRQFTGMRNFQLENHNISSQKWYDSKLQEFQEKIIISPTYLNIFLQSKFIQHFYTHTNNGTLADFKPKYTPN